MGRCTKNIHAQAIASQWFDSGMTQAEYARQNNLSIHSLKYWLYKKEKEKTCKEAGAFVELKNIPGGNSIIMKYLNGVELQFPAGTPVQILSKISPQARRGSPDGYIFSTVLGLVPFLWGGQSEVFWFAFAAGSIGGLLFSLLAILLYLPLFLKLHYKS
jgi:hypothetical protein